MEGNVNDDHKIGLRATMAANEVTRQRGWVQAAQRSVENKGRITQDCMDTLKAMSVFSWDVYARRLAAKGYDLQLRRDSNGEVRGYTVRMGNSIFKSSELGKGRNLVPSKIEATWRKMHPFTQSQTYTHSEQSSSPRIASIPQPKPAQNSVSQATVLHEIDDDSQIYTIQIPEKAYNAMKDEVAEFKMDRETSEQITNVALLLFANYIDAATSMSESHGGGGSIPSSGWGRDKDDDWEWAKRCAIMAHSMITTPKIRRGRRR